MLNKVIRLFTISIGLSGAFMLASCDKEDSDSPAADLEAAQPLNTLSVQVNGQVWQPSQLGEDPCMRTIKVAQSAITHGMGKPIPYYTILASYDPKGDTNPNVNALELRIMNVVNTGTYDITGIEVEHYNSFAVFMVNKPGQPTTRYINKTDKANFKATVDEFYPIPGSAIIGIKGTFSGTLYNENNPLDSLTFEKGKFKMKKIGWNTFNQCEE